MSPVAERYTRLSHAYVQLSDRFQKLDLEYMTLRSKIVPLLKAVKAYKQITSQLQKEKVELQSELKETLARYEELKGLEQLLQPDVQALLMEAEDQMTLVEETIHEMDCDRDPDLSEDDKALLKDYENNPSQFVSTGTTLIPPHGTEANQTAPIA